jgi:dTMP kinase
METRPRFVTLEGGEGAGKSTQGARLKAALETRGISCVLTREPGGSPGAESIRKLLVQGERDKWDSKTETLLLFAARSDHIKRLIKPALDSGIWVICDRFIDSTYAYQGSGRGVPHEFIRDLESLVLDGWRPDLTLILDIEPNTGLARTSGRALPLFDPSLHNATDTEAKVADRRAREEARFERFGVNFHRQLRSAFRDIATQNPDRCAIIDAGKSVIEVEHDIWLTVATRFGL